MALTLRHIALVQLFWLGCLWSPAQAAAVHDTLPEDSQSAVILAYHRIGEDAYPDSDIETGQFLAHMQEITEGAYNVMSLPDLIAALRKKETLPPRTIAITFEGAFKSALVNAIPALLEKKIPFTVFYSSDYADSDAGPYMNWTDLKMLSGYKEVSIGLLPSGYTRLSQETKAEIRRQVNKARQRHREMLGAEARFFSYPFGEYTPAYKKIVEDSGFDAAFGLQSGAAYGAADFYALPRFTMTEKYGDLERFRTAAQSLPFPATDIEPQDMNLVTDRPAIGFSVPAVMQPALKNMSCFASGQPEPAMEILDTRVELRLKEPVQTPRIRINCTLPGPLTEDDTQLWRWFGMLLVKPEEEAIQPQTGLP